MKKIIGIIIGAVIIIFLVLGIARTRKKEDVLSITKIQKQEGIPVFAKEVVRGNVQQVHNYYGTVRSKDQSTVTSKLMERIDKILVVEGDRVKKGQLLVVFDTTATQAAVPQARLQYQNSKRDLARMKKLYKEGAISKQTLDQVKLGYGVAKANYETALSAVEVRAPISGVVSMVDVEAGALAHPGDILLQIVNHDQYEVPFDVTQEDRNQLREGQAVQVHLDRSEPVDGVISHIGLAASSKTRMFTAYADIPVTPEMYPGVLVTVNVAVENRENVLTVPIEAVVVRDDKNVVFVIDDGIAHLTPVEEGLVGENVVEIKNGLTEGETVAVYGLNNLGDGAKVKVVSETESSASK